MTTTTTRAHRPTKRRQDLSLSLDDLSRMSSEELDALYRRGAMPKSLHALDGAPRGRMLTLRGPVGLRPSRDLIAAIARAPFFPWRGKSFSATDDGRGSGINRVILLGELYRFETRFEDSAIDGSPCVRLDYDLPENPFFIRAIRDEVREVAPGLFLGPAMLDGERPELVLWFGLDTRVA